MMNECELLRSAIAEYESTVKTQQGSDLHGDPKRLARALSSHHDWTERGAEAVVSLVNQYGAFMLRNALALAVVLDKEDGDLVF